MIDTTRLITPADDFESAFPGLNFRNRRSLVTAGEKVLLVDPIYIADVYNSTNEPACYLRDHGLFLMNFGGDIAAPVWWKPPFLLLPTLTHLSEDDLKPTQGVEVLAAEIGCDSGSFVFLPLTATLPPNVQSKVKEVLEKENGAGLRLSAGTWTAFYEQFKPRIATCGAYTEISC